MNELWRKLQKKEWDLYLEQGPVGTFSVDGLKGAEMTGQIINNFIPHGYCLDVGCGALAYPSYMKAAPNVFFYGIDPYEGEERDFHFEIGYAENLLFSDGEMDGVLFATSLDHVVDPVVALEEAYRVLRCGGYLFIWTSLRSNNKKYQRWLAAEKPAQYDAYHMWAFTEKSLLELAKSFIFVEKVSVRKTEAIFIFKK